MMLPDDKVEVVDCNVNVVLFTCPGVDFVSSSDALVLLVLLLPCQWSLWRPSLSDRSGVVFAPSISWLEDIMVMMVSVSLCKMLLG